MAAISITLKPLIDKAAMVVENEFKTLVIADLHLGIEAELRQKGINIGSQTKKLSERAIKCVKAAEPDVIVLLGDVKHAVPRISWMDRKEVPFFLAELAEYAPVYVVKGNHDGHLNRLLPKATEREPEHEVSIKSTRGFLFDGVGYTHGHSWPSQDLFSAKYILIGHNHPRIRLVSPSSHYTSMKPVWIRAKCDYEAVKKQYPELRIKGWNDPWVIIMPAFNEICGGVTFNSQNRRLLGPIASKLLRSEDMEVYLLDGTYIGKVGDLA
ncbi:MAG: metallophosphoesterase [Methanophagales archaeon]|nr:metallophosphoesterase [Methanophagales archaeon]